MTKLEQNTKGENKIIGGGGQIKCLKRQNKPLSHAIRAEKFAYGRRITLLEEA